MTLQKTAFSAFTGRFLWIFSRNQLVRQLIWRCSGVFGRGTRHGVRLDLVPFDRLRLPGQRLSQYLVGFADRDNVQTFLHIIRDVGEILFIVFGNQNRLDSAPERRQQLLLQAADRQNPARAA